jgi:prevent-host-death family protein
MSSTTSQVVSLNDAAAQLTELVRLAQQGTEVVIVEDGLPLARLVRPESPESLDRLRVAGLNEGEVWISEDFNAELPEEFWLGKE